MFVVVSLSLENSRIAMLLHLLILVSASLTIPTSLGTFGPGQSIRDGENRSIVSENGQFELGFFSPGDSKNRYLGIWYKDVTPSVYVWVANRETPLSDSYGLLHFTRQGVLLLLTGINTTIWSSNPTASGLVPVLQFMDSGNLVVKEEKDNSSIFWQSFDHPGDTLLPGMKIGRNFATGMDRFLTSWKRADDPASGQFSLWIDPEGYPQLVLRNGSLKHYRLGSWNGLRFTGTPELPPSDQFLKYEFVLNKNEVFYSYEVPNPMLSMLLVNRSGFLERFVHAKDSTSQATLYFAPRDQCDYFSFCGAYMICKMIDNSPICSCLEGFVPRFPDDTSKGCARSIPLNCTGDIFQNYTRIKLPDTSLSWYDTSMSMSLTICREMCSRNCSCAAFTNTNIIGEGSGCLLWFGDLIDMREFSTGGQDLYIRMSIFKPDHFGTKTKLSRSKLIGITISVVLITGMLMIGFIVFLRNRKRRNQGRRRNKGGDNEDVEIFDLDTILNATDHFSNNNKLGQGGFGPVYKGTLTDGKEIAVKRLSKSSTQGLKEFENEVIMIAKLQHRNLVKLLGCCLEADEIMLIYEFMPKKSLDFFIFDQTRSIFLDWNKRYLIIGGIARGLLYLHQDSRLRIVHRDLKASNILLDNDMNPKISDFGMARIFGGDQTEANTNKIVGTYGYMAPEYTVDGHFSVKSDVFSFGVLVLEIVSGKKNRGFSHQDHSHNLLGHAWKLWNEERALELVDRMVDDSYSVSKVLRCIHIGLLCVQQRTEDRPSMTSVVVMLGSEGALPDPKQPGFFTERSVPAESGSSTSMQESSSSVNEITMSVLRAR